MPMCFDCSRLAPLEKRPASKLDSGQWGMLARGLVYCGHLEQGQTYKRFRSCEAAGPCPFFVLEPDESKREGRRTIAAKLRAEFAKRSERGWR